MVYPDVKGLDIFNLGQFYSDIWYTWVKRSPGGVADIDIQFKYSSDLLVKVEECFR